METHDEIEKSILVPTDFSEACDNALNHAIELAKFLNSKVYVLHVIDDLSKDFFTKNALEMGTAVNSFSDSLKITNEKLKAYTDSKNNSCVVPILKEGDLFISIKEVATKINAGIILLGTHGKHGFQKIIGSYALKVIDKTKIPVIVVQKRGFGAGYKDIVFPVNLSDEDRQKVDYAIQLSDVFKSTIHILPQVTESKIDKTKIEIIVDQIKTHFIKHNVKHTIADASEYGEVWDRQVLNYSSSINADLILIMSNPDKHMIFFDAKEENIMFNSAQIPVFCVTYKNTKISAFWNINMVRK